MRSPLLALLALPLLALAQLTTLTDAAGDIIEASLLTNARGSVTSTSILETLSTATQVQGGNVAAPASTCTTEGCTAPPTTYTVSGAIVTFVPTTWTTPIPTWTSSGQIEAISGYVTTTYTTSLIAGGRRLFQSLSGDWTFMVLGTVTSALIGLMMVL